MVGMFIPKGGRSKIFIKSSVIDFERFLSEIINLNSIVNTAETI